MASVTEYYPYIQKACAVLINREERFSKTAVGWVLRDISKYDEDFVVSFVENNLESFSKESLDNALKYFDQDRKYEYLQKVNKA